jgi:hypothetical protein
MKWKLSNIIKSMHHKICHCDICLHVARGIFRRWFKSMIEHCCQLVTVMQISSFCMTACMMANNCIMKTGNRGSLINTITLKQFIHVIYHCQTIYPRYIWAFSTWEIKYLTPVFGQSCTLHRMYIFFVSWNSPKVRPRKHDVHCINLSSAKCIYWR